MEGTLGGENAPLVLSNGESWSTISSIIYIHHVLYTVLWTFRYWKNQAMAHEGARIWVMEDNASAHKARLTEARCDYYNMPSLSCPACSPELNLIGNVWNLLKSRINMRTPRG